MQLIAASDYFASFPGTIVVDSLSMDPPYLTTGTFQSRVFDALGAYQLGRAVVDGEHAVRDRRRDQHPDRQYGHAGRDVDRVPGRSCPDKRSATRHATSVQRATDDQQRSAFAGAAGKC